MKAYELIGRRYGRLVVLDQVATEPGTHSVWKVRCDCGREFNVFASNLYGGRTKSCGCLRKELLVERNSVRSRARFKQGEGGLNHDADVRQDHPPGLEGARPKLGDSQGLARIMRGGASDSNIE